MISIIIITDSEASAITWIKSNMSNAFYLTYLGLLHYLFCVDIWKTGNNIFVSPAKCARSLLDMFKMVYCKIFSTPM